MVLSGLAPLPPADAGSSRTTRTAQDTVSVRQCSSSAALCYSERRGRALPKVSRLLALLNRMGAVELSRADHGHSQADALGRQHRPPPLNESLACAPDRPDDTVPNRTWSSLSPSPYCRSSNAHAARTSVDAVMRDPVFRLNVIRAVLKEATSGASPGGRLLGKVCAETRSNVLVQ